jgi:hypothetical protein
VSGAKPDPLQLTKLERQQMKKFYVHIPGWAHSMNAYGINKRDAIQRFKEQHYMIRMPSGYGIWEA